MNAMLDRKDFFARGIFEFWLQWVFANLTGCVFGIFISLLMLRIIPNEIICSIFLGTTIGMRQWFILGQYFGQSRWWILVTSLGVLAGFALVNAIHMLTVGAIAFIPIVTISFMLFGSVVGIAQWIVLRQYFRKAGWWVMANAVGWSLGALITLIVDLQIPELAKLIFDYLIIGVIVGARTGITLIHLIKNSIPLETGKSNSQKGLLAAGCVSFVVIVLCIYLYLERTPDDLSSVPSKETVTVCKNLPPMECIGNDMYCKAIVYFQPKFGRDYIDYPFADETWDDQYRSYLRRDLMMLVKYATGRVGCESSTWDYCPVEPLMLIDMGEKDGAIPGTSRRRISHPWGSHQGGADIDIAYYQLGSQSFWHEFENSFDERRGNVYRPVCQHTRFGMEVHHCTHPPGLLDLRRTALLIIFLSEHPGLRVIGVDGKVGIALEKILDNMVEAGRLTFESRTQIPLSYELENTG